MSVADLDTIARIEGEVYEFPWTRNNFADSLSAGYSAWVCRLHGDVAGYAVMILVLDEAHILNLSIRGDLQGRGLGRALLEHLIDVVRGYRGRFVLLEVRPSNPAAMRLYRRRGFTEIGRRRGYYPAHGGREDAIVMRCAL